MRKTKVIAFSLILALILNIILPLMTVVAVSNTETLSVSFREGNESKGKVQYSLDDGAHWNDVTEDTSNINISVLGDNLRLKIVPFENYSTDYAGIELNLDGAVISGLSEYGLESEGGYIVPANIQSVALEMVEFRYDDGGQQGGNPVYDSTAHVNVAVLGTEIENPYGEDASEIRISVNGDYFVPLELGNVTYTYENIDNEQKIYSVTTNNPMNIEYQDISEENVIIGVRTQWNTFLTNVTINGISYANQLPKNKDDLIALYNNQELRMKFEVPKDQNNNYNIIVEGRKQHENEIIMGNFLWDYNEQGYTSEEDKIFHSTLQFIKAEYGNNVLNSVNSVNNAGELYAWHDVERKEVYANEFDGVGSATFPVGTKLTVAIIPDPGYQLISFGVNEGGFEPQEQIGVYTFEIEGGNFHLQAHVTDVDNEVVSGSVNVKDGNIDINIENDESFENGTAKLEVNDIASMSPNRMEQFEATATNEGYEIENYLDIALYNSVYKGGNKDANGNFESWDTPVENIKNEAKITLELENNMSGKELAIVHEKHNGNTITGYELIDATYNEKNNTISFETDSFSNYAIISKEKTEKENYVLTLGNATFTFTDEANHDFEVTFIDVLTLTDEELELFGITRQEFTQILDIIKENTSKYGSLLNVYNLEIEDANLAHTGKTDIKIKMTDEMKKYNIFKLIYLDDENNFKVEDIVELKINGEYIEGTLPHLSAYALIGSNSETPPPSIEDVKNKTNNPPTGDNIIITILIFVIATIGVFITLKVNKNRRIGKH